MWFKNGYGDIYIFIFGGVKISKIEKRDRKTWWDDKGKKHKTNTYYIAKNKDAFYFYDYEENNLKLWGFRSGVNFVFNKKFDDVNINYKAIKRLFEGKEMEKGEGI